MDWTNTIYSAFFALIWLCNFGRAEFGFCDETEAVCDDNCNAKWGVCVEVPKCKGEYMDAFGCVPNIILFVGIGLGIIVAVLVLICICCICCSCCIFAKFLNRRKERQEAATVLKPPPENMSNTILIEQSGFTPVQQYTITTTTKTEMVPVDMEMTPMVEK